MIKLEPGMKVTCPTKEDMIFALELLEDEGFTWINGGEKPTQWTPWTKVPNHSFPDSINFHSDEKGKLKICRGSYPSGAEWTLPAEDLFLHFLAQDMENRPENVKPVDAELWAEIKELTSGVEVDLDAPLTDD